MPRTHVVKSGECMLRVARHYGIANYKPLYEHPDNAKLRRKRPNPSILHPGDAVAIPDPHQKKAGAPTGSTRAFTLSTGTRHLRLSLRDSVGEALAKKPYLLLLGQQVLEGATDAEGFLEHQVPLGADTASLECEGHCWELALGTLLPMRETPDDGVAGAQARLINLGYALNPTGRMTLELRSAIRAFQHHNGLSITGRLDAETVQRLEEQHGS